MATRVSRALLLEQLEETAGRRALGRLEVVDLVPQSLQEDVEVPHRAQRAAEPGQLRPQRLRPGRVEQRQRGPQHGAQPRVATRA